MTRRAQPCWLARGPAFVCLLALWLAMSGPAAAGMPSALVADSVRIEADRTLIAEGNVEVVRGGTVLHAERITYSAGTDRLTIAGPITLERGDGSVLLASHAALSPDLRDGILQGARLVLDRQLQLAAADIRRVDGRYSQLTKTVASSCRVCGDGAPLWRIRARRIVHDEAERFLYFENARLEFIGLPVVYLPRLRLPDPSNTRARGFLVPSIRSTSELGTGLKLPYFVPVGRNADITVTPYLSTDRTRTLQLRYRQAFRRGRVEALGAVSQDDIREGETRGFVFAEGRFRLPEGFRLDLDIETVSDPAYLLDYGYTDTDRLESSARLSRVRRDEAISAELAHFHSLRASEDNSTLPTLLGEARIERRFTPAMIGGRGSFTLEAAGHRRNSDLALDTDGDGIAEGLDLGRATARLDWRRDWTLAGGVRLAAETALTADRYRIGQDASRPDGATRTTPAAAVTLRWPLRRVEAGGAVQVLEPVAQIAWSASDPGAIPNETSRAVPFDEGNLFALDRFPGADRREDGLRANLGLGWSRHAAGGWSVGAAVGKVLRREDSGQFTTGSGLGGLRSDWLATASLRLPGRTRLTNRALLDDDLSITRNELRLDLDRGPLDLATSYVYLEEDPAAGLPGERSEWRMDAALRLGRHWIGTSDWRFDFANDRATSAGLGLEYRNECISVGVSLSRRFTSSTNVRPTTDFGLSIALNGFGTSPADRSFRRTCLQ